MTGPERSPMNTPGADTTDRPSSTAYKPVPVGIVETVHNAICDALPEWIKWRRTPRWRGDYAEQHARVATDAVLAAVAREGYEITRREEFSAFDLRFRSLDRQEGEPYSLCSECRGIASWSVWLHTPEWGEGNAGETRVLCSTHAVKAVVREVNRGTR